MKHTLLILMLGAGYAAADTADDYVNFVRQIQKDTGVEWDMVVAPEGMGTALEGVPDVGAKFELWTVHNQTASEYLLDQKFVTAYYPDSGVSILSSDPYDGDVPRTRVDQPYEVLINVQGLTVVTPGSAAPPAVPILSKNLAKIQNEINETKVELQLVQNELAGFSGKEKDREKLEKEIVGLQEDLVKLGGDYDKEYLKEKENRAKEAAKLAEKAAKEAKKKKKDKGSWWELEEDGTVSNPDPDHNLGNNVGDKVEPVDPSNVLVIHNAYTYAPGKKSLKGSGLEFSDNSGPGNNNDNSGPGNNNDNSGGNDNVSNSTDGNAYGHAKKVGELKVGENGTTRLQFGRANLESDDLTMAAGEEVFTVTALAGAERSETVLDSGKIQVWPIARAKIAGYNKNKIYNSAPPVTIDLKDLYPSSVTYMRMYHGEPTANPAEVMKIADSYAIIEDAIPHDRSMVLKRLDAYMEKGGTYTMEVVHKTPFGVELLAQDTINMRRTVKVRGSLFSAEVAPEGQQNGNNGNNGIGIGNTGNGNSSANGNSNGNGN